MKSISKFSNKIKYWINYILFFPYCSSSIIRLRQYNYEIYSNEYYNKSGNNFLFCIILKLCWIPIIIYPGISFSLKT